MPTTKQKLQQKVWTRDPYIIATDPSLIPIPDLIAMFASEDFYWAKPMPEENMQEMLQNSLSFGLYIQPRAEGQPAANCDLKRASLKLVGFARCVTDFATLIYLTDVHVLPTHQGDGLGKWLIGCVKEVTDSMTHLRRSMLLTADWERTVPFYEKLLGMSTYNSPSVTEEKRREGLAVMMRIGKGWPGYRPEDQQ